MERAERRGGRMERPQSHEVWSRTKSPNYREFEANKTKATDVYMLILAVGLQSNGLDRVISFLVNFPFLA
jgi:hypothetical protein